MDLRGMKRISSPECFICRWAGKFIVIWPQSPGHKPVTSLPDDYSFTSNKVYSKNVESWTSGTWHVYINVHEHIQGLRSRHTEIEACPNHWYELAGNWVKIAHDEVQLETVWNDYIGRIER